MRFCGTDPCAPEIQEAVAALRNDEKKALALWLNSQTALELSAEDEQRLLRSLDEAIRDVDAGKGVPIDAVRSGVILMGCQIIFAPHPELMW